MVRTSTKIKRYLAPFTFTLLQIVGESLIIFEIQQHHHFQGKYTKEMVLSTLFPICIEWICFALVYFFDPGTLENSLLLSPDEGGLTPDEEASLMKCRKCHLPMPPRCHHCNRCEQCYVRHSFHLGIFGICIAIKNLQPFIVLIKWCEINMIVNTIISFIILCSNTCPVLFSIFITIIYFSMIFLFLAFWIDQMGYVKTNLSWSEKKAGVPKQAYNLGKERNIAQVFGYGILRYYVPMRSTMHGFEWLPAPEEDQ